MKDKNTKEREWEQPEPKDFGYWWYEKNYKPKKPLFVERDGKKVYYEKFGEDYIKILSTGQIIKKEKAQKFIDRVLDEAFIENI